GLWCLILRLNMSCENFQKKKRKNLNKKWGSRVDLGLERLWRPDMKFWDLLHFLQRERRRHEGGLLLEGLLPRRQGPQFTLMFEISLFVRKLSSRRSCSRQVQKQKLVNWAGCGLKEKSTSYKTVTLLSLEYKIFTNIRCW